MNLGKLAGFISPELKIGKAAFHQASNNKVIEAIGVAVPGEKLLTRHHQKMPKSNLIGTIKSAPNTAGLDTTRSAYVAGNDTGYSSFKNRPVPQARHTTTPTATHSLPAISSPVVFHNQTMSSNINVDNNLNGIL